jgi:ABC-type Fe3+/spermidine/putrescine transport system ATPase subunit
VSANGWKLNFAGSGFVKGEHVVLAVRPESVILSPDNQQSDREWTGTVREHLLLGDCIRIEIQLENGTEIVSEVPNSGLQPVKVGERVRIYFAEDGIIPYQFPAQGLDVELALE